MFSFVSGSNSRFSELEKKNLCRVTKINIAESAHKFYQPVKSLLFLIYAEKEM
jgi:hypothetical protein